MKKDATCEIIEKCNKNSRESTDVERCYIRNSIELEGWAKGRNKVRTIRYCVKQMEWRQNKIKKNLNNLSATFEVASLHKTKINCSLTCTCINFFRSIEYTRSYIPWICHLKKYKNKPPHNRLLELIMITTQRIEIRRFFFAAVRQFLDSGF